MPETAWTMPDLSGHESVRMWSLDMLGFGEEGSVFVRGMDLRDVLEDIERWARDAGNLGGSTFAAAIEVLSADAVRPLV